MIDHKHAVKLLCMHYSVNIIDYCQNNYVT